MNSTVGMSTSQPARRVRACDSASRSDPTAPAQEVRRADHACFVVARLCWCEDEAALRGGAAHPERHGYRVLTAPDGSGLLVLRNPDARWISSSGHDDADSGGQTCTIASYRRSDRGVSLWRRGYNASEAPGDRTALLSVHQEAWTLEENLGEPLRKALDHRLQAAYKRLKLRARVRY